MLSNYIINSLRILSLLRNQLTQRAYVLNDEWLRKSGYCKLSACIVRSKTVWNQRKRPYPKKPKPESGLELLNYSNTETSPSAWQGFLTIYGDFNGGFSLSSFIK